MRLHGNLKTWNDDRGFGFIQPADGGQEIFVHIKAFPRGSDRPVVGQTLTFEIEVGPNGKRRAHLVQYPMRSGARKPPRAASTAPWSLPRLLILPLFVGVWVCVASLWPVGPLMFVLYVGVSVWTFLMYAFDKAAAQSGAWRTPESTLHLLDLAGGWPGALLAQQLLRHKSSKQSFVAVFWLTVMTNIAAFVAWHAVLQARL